MVPESPESTDRKDISPAIPLEISAELAASVDELLQDFAEGAELETALVVERSGALVSGISAEAEVMVDIISALVAGASAAMNALIKELGGSGKIESFHQSKERAVYLAQVMDRFILVGVSTVPVPVGVIREKARQIRPALLQLLEGVKFAAPPSSPAPIAPSYSLRDMALKEASQILPESPEETAESLETESDAEVDETIFFGDEESEAQVEPAMPSVPEVLKEKEEARVEIDDPEGIYDIDLPTSEPEIPTEVIELLEDEGPEVVIEDSSGSVIDSPFETDDDFEMEEETLPTESIFELEEETETEEPPVFEVDEDEEVIFEADEDEDEADEQPPVFEIDEEEDLASAFELEPAEEATESVDEETDSVEEEETTSSGPFYF